MLAAPVEAHDRLAHRGTVERDPVDLFGLLQVPRGAPCRGHVVGQADAAQCLAIDAPQRGDAQQEDPVAVDDVSDRLLASQRTPVERFDGGRHYRIERLEDRATFEHRRAQAHLAQSTTGRAHIPEVVVE